MKKRLLGCLLAAIGAAGVHAQEITPVWVQHINDLINVDPANKLPILRKGGGTDNNNGQSTVDSYGKMLRYDADRFLLMIRENGINETTANAEEQALAQRWPDRCLIWVDANTGKPGEVAHVFGVVPVTSPGQGSDLDYFSQWGMDDGEPGQRVLYYGHKNAILRYAPKAGGGWESTPTIAWREPTPGALDENGQPLDDSSGGDGSNSWRWRNFRVTGKGANTVLLAGGGTWRASMHPQIFVTTDGLKFTPRARVNDRDGGRKGVYSLGGLSSHVVKHDKTKPNVEVVYHGHYPGTGWDARPNRYVFDPDDPEATYYDDTYAVGGQVAIFQGMESEKGGLKAFSWEAAGKDGRPINHAVDGVDRYDGNWNLTIDTDTSLEYLVAYAMPSWNNQFGAIKKPGWLGIHRLDGSIASGNSSFKLNFRETDELVDGQTGSTWGYDGDLTVYPDTTAPANLDKTEVLWVGAPYGFGRFTVQNVPAAITTHPVSKSVNAGRDVELFVVATGSPNTYQWYKGANAIPGETKDRILLRTVDSSDAGSYTVKISNPLGEITSNAAVLTVTGQVTIVDATGFLSLDYFGGIDGSDVDLLTSDPRYPSNPDYTTFISPLDTRSAFPDDSRERYGARIHGWLTPADTGAYDFFLASDDASQLWLSTDATEQNYQLIAYAPGAVGEFFEPGSVDAEGNARPQVTAAPITLEAGKKYAIQVLYKEGGGGDFARVAWRNSEETNPTPVANLKPIPGRFLSTRAIQNNTAVSISQQPPATLQVKETHTATLTVGAATDPAGRLTFVQWQRNGVDIPGGNGATYRFNATAADDGASYRAIVSVPGASVTSEATVLDVVSPFSDVTGDFDKVVRVVSRASDASVSLRASEGDETPGVTKGVRIVADANVTVRAIADLNEDGTSLSGEVQASRTYSGVDANLPNQWLRLKRVGDNFTAYVSRDGTTWAKVANRYIDGLADTLKVGIVVTGVAEFADFRDWVPTDTTAPTLVSVGTLDKKIIGVRFSEAVTSATSTVKGNYTISQGTIDRVEHGLNHNTVHLYVSGLTSDTFTVTVNGVKDAAGNTIAAGSSAQGKVSAGWEHTDVGVFVDPNNRPQDGDDPYVISKVVALSSGDKLDMEIIGGGGNIWNDDRFVYVYKPYTGDFDVAAEVTRFDRSAQTAGYAHAGIHVRPSLYLPGEENTLPGTRVPSYIYTTYAEANQERSGIAVWRTNPGEGHGADGVVSTGEEIGGIIGRFGDLIAGDAAGTPLPKTSPEAARWVRVIREGNKFRGLSSHDGQTWVELPAATREITMPATVLVGFSSMTDTNGKNPGHYSVLNVRNFGDFSVVGPDLAISRSGNNLTISWEGEGFTLESANAVDGPWADSGLTITSNGASKSVTFTASAAARFYRLKK